MAKAAPYGERIEYIDIARGIGIILVVLGHCVAIPLWLNHFIFSVHMPLFFILSGFTFRAVGCDGTKRFLKKSAGALLVPYAISCVIIILIQTISALVKGEDALYEFIRWVVSSVYASGTHYLECIETAGIPITFIGALWFLPALFFARVLFMFILRSRTPFLWVAASFFAGYVSARKIGWLPFSFQAGMCAVLFLYIGYMIRQKDLFRWEAVHWVLKIIMLLAWIYCIIFCGSLWMVSNTFIDGFLDIMGSVAGTFIIVYISQGIERAGPLKRVMCVLGKISLGIMCAHCIVLDCWPMSYTCGILMEKTGFSYCISEIIIQFLVTAAVTAILFFIPWVNRKLFPAYRQI